MQLCTNLLYYFMKWSNNSFYLAQSWVLLRERDNTKQWWLSVGHSLTGTRAYPCDWTASSSVEYRKPMSFPLLHRVAVPPRQTFAKASPLLHNFIKDFASWSSSTRRPHFLQVFRLQTKSKKKTENIPTFGMSDFVLHPFDKKWRVGSVVLSYVCEGQNNNNKEVACPLH